MKTSSGTPSWIAGLVVAIAAPVCLAQGILHVDANGDMAPHDGSDWRHAFLTVSAALHVAAPGTEIRIADGVYRPDSTGLTNPRKATFAIPGGVAVRGGYAGAGDGGDLQDVAAFPTVLSGDLGVPGDDADNAYHVVTIAGQSTPATLSSLIITGGNATDAPNDRRGGGLLLTAASITLQDCRIHHNAAEFGGGLFCSESTVIMRECSIDDNIAAVSGGGLYLLNSSFAGATPAEIAGSTFERNRCSGFGGAVRAWEAAGAFLSCTFADNTALNGGGALAFGGAGGTSIDRCQFHTNRCGELPGAADALGAAVLASEACTVQTASSVFHANVVLPVTPWVSGGGALAATDDAAVTIITSTMHTNDAIAGRAVYLADQATAEVYSSILHDGEGEVEEAGAGAATITYSYVAGGWTGLGNTTTDPLLDDLRLTPGSSAINTGDPAYTPPITDLDGHARVLCGRVDMGAYEFGIGDYTCDQMVNLADWAHWPACTTGPAGVYSDPACAAFDTEFDTDVDLRDFARLR